MKLTKEEQIVAYIANPYLDYPIKGIDKIPLEFINANKLSLLLNEKGINVGKIDKEKKKIAVNEILELKHAFSDCGVAFVIIKTIEKLPKPIGDIDILVNDISRAEFELRQKGYTLEGIEPPFSSLYYKSLYVKNVNGKKIGIHLHSEIAWEGIKYLESSEINEIFENSVKREVESVIVPVPSPEHEILITIIHTFFERGNYKITLFDTLNIFSLIKESDINMELIETSAKRKNLHKHFLLFIRTVGAIYKELYGEILPSLEILNTNHIKIKKLPFIFPIHTIISLRAQKIYLDLKYFGMKKSINNLHTYLRDIIEVIKERYGITSLKRRIRR